MVMLLVVSLVVATAAVVLALARAAAVRARVEQLEAALQQAVGERDAHADALRRLEPEASALRERVAVLGEVERRLADHLKLVAGDVLEKSSATLQASTRQILEPFRESLERVDRQAQALEQARRQAQGALTQHLQMLAEGQERLRTETGNLVTALRTPHVRGRWGEVQLKRVIEFAGMVAHCDFVEQTSVADGDGRLLRPDVVVRLPGGKSVVVDAKTPLDAYLGWIEAGDDATRSAQLAAHATQVKDHVTRLAAKRYWQQFEPAPQFVIMFVPDESFLRAAQEHDAAIQETAWRAGVIVASPTNLITILRTIAAVWQEETVAENARAISQLGRELYERVGTLGQHVTKVGRCLDGAVGAYNEAVGSLESRLLVTARKFEQHGIGCDDELPELKPVERAVRPLQAIELRDDDAEQPPALTTGRSAAA